MIFAVGFIVGAVASVYGFIKWLDFQTSERGWG